MDVKLNILLDQEVYIKYCMFYMILSAWTV